MQTIEKETELQGQGLACVSEAKKIALDIKDHETYSAADEYLKTVKGFQKMIAEYYDPDIKKANELHKSLTGKRGALLKPLELAEKSLKEAMGKYLELEAMRVKAEQERLLAEQKKQAEEMLINAAQEAESIGNMDKAAAILSAPVMVAPVNLAMPKSQSSSSYQVWRVDVVNKLAFIRAIAEGKAPESLVEVNITGLELAARLQNSDSPYPGVRAWTEYKIRAKSA